jgi:ABC-type branched-subunit amino acid transport system substrate-binding protein
MEKSAIIYAKGDFGKSSADSVTEELNRSGIAPLAVETHTIGDSDYSGQILKFKKLGVKVLFLMTYTSDAAKILKQSHELGLECVMFGHIGADFGIFPAVAGKEGLKNYYGATCLEDVITGDKLKGFREMYLKEYPKYMENPNNPSMSDVSCYAGMFIIAEALKKAGRDLTRTKFIKALESLNNFKPPYHPTISFSSTQHEGLLTLHYVKYKDAIPMIVKE